MWGGRAHVIHEIPAASTFCETHLHEICWNHLFPRYNCYKGGIKSFCWEHSENFIILLLPQLLITGLKYSKKYSNKLLGKSSLKEFVPDPTIKQQLWRHFCCHWCLDGTWISEDLFRKLEIETSQLCTTGNTATSHQAHHRGSHSPCIKWTVFKQCWVVQKPYPWDLHRSGGLVQQQQWKSSDFECFFGFFVSRLAL